MCCFLDVNIIHHPHLLLIHSHHLSIIFHLIFLWFMMILNFSYNCLNLIFLSFMKHILKLLYFRTFITHQCPWMLRTLMSLLWLMVVAISPLVLSLMLLQQFLQLIMLLFLMKSVLNPSLSMLMIKSWTMWIKGVTKLANMSRFGLKMYLMNGESFGVII